MRRIITVGILLAFAASALILFGGWFLAKDRGSEFWSNYFLNVSAELAGFAITAFVASVAARRNLDKWVRPLVNLIAHLRKSENINGPTARSAVICAVRIFSEERFLQKRPMVSVLSNDAHCKVCLMTANVERQQDNTVRCTNCLLPSDLWDHDAV